MKMIRITSTVEGFRRAGMAHSKSPAEYPAEQFSDEQLAMLKAEDRLVVEEFEADPPTKTDRPNAQEAIKLAAAAETIEALDALLEGEDRATVLKAIEKRREELTKE